MEQLCEQLTVTESVAMRQWLAREARKRPKLSSLELLEKAAKHFGLTFNQKPGTNKPA